MPHWHRFWTRSDLLNSAEAARGCLFEEAFRRFVLAHNRRHSHSSPDVLRHAARARRMSGTCRAQPGVRDALSNEIGQWVAADDLAGAWLSACFALGYMLDATTQRSCTT